MRGRQTGLWCALGMVVMFGSALGCLSGQRLAREEAVLSTGWLTKRACAVRWCCNQPTFAVCFLCWLVGGATLRCGRTAAGKPMVTNPHMQRLHVGNKQRACCLFTNPVGYLQNPTHSLNPGSDLLPSTAGRHTVGHRCAQLSVVRHTVVPLTHTSTDSTCQGGCATHTGNKKAPTNAAQLPLPHCRCHWSSMMCILSSGTPCTLRCAYSATASAVNSPTTSSRTR